MINDNFTIQVTNIGEQFNCKSEKSLLSGMELQQKKAIKIGCRGGGCGICKIRILSGKYEAKKMSIKHITAEEAENNLALSCRIFPRSDMNIESIDN
jgi:ferredoxin